MAQNGLVRAPPTGGAQSIVGFDFKAAGACRSALFCCGLGGADVDRANVNPPLIRIGNWLRNSPFPVGWNATCHSGQLITSLVKSVWGSRLRVEPTLEDLCHRYRVIRAELLSDRKVIASSITTALQDKLKWTSPQANPCVLCLLLNNASWSKMSYILEESVGCQSNVGVKLEIVFVLGSVKKKRKSLSKMCQTNRKRWS